MSKHAKLILTICLMMSGCGKQQTTTDAAPETTSPSFTESGSEVYEAFHSAVKNRIEKDTWTAAVSSMYKMKFSDDTYDVYSLDGVLAKGEDGRYRFSENFDSNGVCSTMAGWYYEGRLYNNYNGITYYEDMTEDDVREMMITPLSPYSFSEDQIDTIGKSADEEGSSVYMIVLTTAAASSLFEGRYDIYGLSSYDDYTVTSGVVYDTFDSQGCFTGESVQFNVYVSYLSEGVDIVFNSNLNYTLMGSTSVDIDEELLGELLTYVSYNDIDTSAIVLESDDDDALEKDTETTFAKRLRGRLGYEYNDDGTLSVSYNEHLGYTIDFANKTFMYSSYSINYIYSWNGDIGTMGDCTYNYVSKRASSGCQEETVEKMEEVKQYLIMELYYCGLTLDDLINNTPYQE